MADFPSSTKNFAAIRPTAGQKLSLAGVWDTITGELKALSDKLLDSASPLFAALNLNKASGDPVIIYKIAGTEKFTEGVDDDDSDKFKIAAGSALGTNDRLTIDSTGNVGIGTSSPTSIGANYKTLEISSSDGSYILLKRTNATAVTVDFAADNGAGYLGTKTSHPMIYRTNDTERMRIDSSGHVITNSITLGNGTTYNAANELDDYEEGTWTPVIGGSGGTSGQSYGTQNGKYTKIGNVVYVSCYVVLSAKGTITGNLQLQGLPYTSDGGSYYPAISISYAGGWTLTASHILNGYFDNSVTNVFLSEIDYSGGTPSALTTSAITNSSFIMLSGFYYST